MTLKNHIDGQKYADEFKAQAAGLPGAELPWLNELRNASIAKFAEAGLPGPRVEEWKYCNLNVLKSGAFNVSGQKTSQDTKVAALIKTALLDDIDGAKVVFVDGYFQQSLSNIDKQNGVTLTNLAGFVNSDPVNAKALFDQSDQLNSLKDLNTALMTDGFVLVVEENTKLAEPIQIIHLSSDNSNDKALRQRNFIQLEVGSKAQIIETFIGKNDVNCWDHNNTDVIIGEQAALEIYQFQNEGDDTIHMAETVVDVAKGGDFKHYSLNIGGKLSRTEVKPTLNGVDCNIELRGAFLGRGGNSHDVFTHMKHMQPECNSNQVYRGVLDNGGKSAFQGKVYVAKDAQLTNADQSNKNLLLDRNAEANSKPELLIYADDVKCSHGTTVGELDAEALFYLKSRGLAQMAAKSLLVEAFVAEVFEEINIPTVKEKYLSLARKWLEVEG